MTHDRIVRGLFLAACISLVLPLWGFAFLIWAFTTGGCCGADSVWASDTIEPGEKLKFAALIGAPGSLGLALLVCGIWNLRSPR